MITTGFNTDSHDTINKFSNYEQKKDIGGINMMFNVKQYKKFRHIFDCIQWDHKLCEWILQNNGLMASTVDSVIDHIGKNGLWSNGITYDHAKKFKNKPIYVLSTYEKNQENEGLSVVYHSIKKIGKIVNSTSNIKNSIVLVAGICFLYTDLISKKNTNICYTTYENFPLPRQWTNTLNEYYDIIMVPHIKIKEMFINSGVNKPIHIIQQGFPKEI